MEFFMSAEPSLLGCIGSERHIISYDMPLDFQ